MKRRAPKRQTSKPSARRDDSTKRNWALVPVDGSAIRKKIKKDYEKALRDLENSRRQLDQFHQTDLPQFTRWLTARFGALITETRELAQKIAQGEELIFQVESESMFTGCSDVRAYQRVMEARENPEPPQSQHADDDERAGQRNHRPENAHAEDPLEEIMNEFFRNFESKAGPQETHDQWAGRHTDPAASTNISARLKELYRAVVRRLHPDTQPSMTAQKTEWWHQAQAAYEARDVEQLEVILTLCEIGDSGTTAHTSASLLQRITAQVKNSLREIKRQLADLRRDPAWDFSRRDDQSALAAQMRGVLTGDLERLRRQHRAIHEMIANWKAAAERLKQPRRRKRPPQNMKFSF